MRRVQRCCSRVPGPDSILLVVSGLVGFRWWARWRERRAVFIVSVSRGYDHSTPPSLLPSPASTERKGAYTYFKIIIIIIII